MTKSKKSIVMRGALLNGPFSAGGLQPAPDGEPGRVRVKRL